MTNPQELIEKIEAILPKAAFDPEAKPTDTHCLGCSQRDLLLMQALSALPQWVAVSEPPPERNKELFITDGKIVGHAIYKGSHFEIVASNCPVKIGDVKWWMYAKDLPLPTPPLDNKE